MKSTQKKGTAHGCWNEWKLEMHIQHTEYLCITLNRWHTHPGLEFSMRKACCVCKAYKIHCGWVFITLSVEGWGAVVSASEEGVLQSLCSSPVSDISEGLEVGQAWDSEGSGKQAVTRDQKERGAVKGGGRHHRRTCKRKESKDRHVSR